MEGLFTDFTNEMSIIYQEENFSGDASDSLQEKFNTLKKKFDGYKGAVERFSKVIEAAKQSAYQTEKVDISFFMSTLTISLHYFLFFICFLLLFFLFNFFI